MSNLHAYFSLRNQQGFSKALDGSRSQTNSSGPTVSSSGGKSWTRSNALSALPPADVNAKDSLGRTVLHLACAATEPYALSYVRLLLAHPNINVNLQDTESRWTALHRALYAGNIAACQLLLQRPEIDVHIRDNEGLTPFDVYNSTVVGASPTSGAIPPDCDPLQEDGCAADLFTWGGNRNAVLGHGDSDDRTYPDHVAIERPDASHTTSKRFAPIRVKSIIMAKLHTTVVTDEKCGNLRACGFGSGGRLGPGQHTQYSLLSVPQFTHHVIAIALGQDHTLALTSDGEVLTWGLNRFSQLGYVVEPIASAGPLLTRAMEEPIQAIARKVIGPLKKEIVVGVAACRVASACWTSGDVFTWGTNNGHLGYDSAAQPVQVLPRKVTGVQRVIGLAMTDTAMVCLLDTKDVICFRDDTRFRVKFPIPELSEFPPYVHPFVVKPPIAKITSCDGVFGALSSRGDVFTFAVPSTTKDSATDRSERSPVNPQRVWSLRKSFDPVRDIALGSDGEIILCTEAGHVFVRSRNTKGGTSSKTLKFHRVPFIHRVVKVCANSTGAFAALRLNYTPKCVKVSGPSLVQDLRDVRPWLYFDGGSFPTSLLGPEYQDEDIALESDVIDVSRLCALLAAEKNAQKNERRGLFRGPGSLNHGADVFVQAGIDIPAHGVVLATRSLALRGLIHGSTSILKDSTVTVKYHRKGTGLPRLVVTGCQPMTILLVLEYLYSDDVPALWDRRVNVPCSERLMRVKVNPAQVKSELEIVSRLLNLPALSAGVSSSVKQVPELTLARDMRFLFTEATVASSSAMKPDVYLDLADRNVACHSIILRARCPFFRSFFDDGDWTVNRWTPQGTLTVDMKHLEWRTMSFILIWLYSGEDDHLFEHLDSVKSVNELLELVFAVMAASSELLLDRLILLCSSTILRYVTLNNVVMILAEATYYNALMLVDSLQDYVASNLEAIMESHLLDDLQPDLIKSLSNFISHRQRDKSPVMRSNLIGNTALLKEASWLELQDFPQPLVRTHRPVKDSPKLSPVLPDKFSLPRRASMPAGSPLSSPMFGATMKPSPPRTPKPTPGDDIFAMEDSLMDAIPVLNIGQPQTPPANFSVPGYAWKTKPPHGSTKVDMKAIMAETVTGKGIPGPGTNVAITDTPEPGSSKWSQKPSQRQRRRIEHQPADMPPEPTQRTSSSGSPWRIPTYQASTATSPAPMSVRGSQPAPPSPGLARTARLSSPPHMPPKAPRPQPATPTSVLQASNAPLGPVFTPALVPRRVSADGPAWASAPTKASPPLPVAGMSFAAIQQQQKAQVQEPKEKRNLREIQEEERAKQEEEDFLKWWTAEEQRLKAEAAVSSNSGQKSPSKRDRGKRRGPRRDNRPGGGGS